MRHFKERIFMNKTCEKLKFLAIFVSLIIIIFGCSLSQTNSNLENAYVFPDYHTPKSQFVPLDFFTILSAIDDHHSKYIVIEGHYSGIIPDPLLDYNGRKRVTKNMQSLHVRESKHSVNRVRIVYPDIHKEDVRALVPLNRHRSRIKVFAYVLPPGETAVLKNGKLFRSFDETLIWLIDVVITFDDGIHYRSPRIRKK